MRLHILPTFGALDLDEITPPRVRAWHAERRKATGATTVAKSYRLLKGILQTAFEDDELIRRNPCRIKKAGREKAPERPIATVAQVDALAEALGPRWRLMVYFAAYATLRPEEQAELRREDIDPETRELSITQASPELTTGRRVTGDPKSEAGIYQHSTDQRQREIAAGLDARVQRDRGKGADAGERHAKGTPRARDA